LSTISNSLTQVRALSSDSAEQKSILQRFLTQNTISPALGKTVWNYLKRHHFSQTRMHYEDISLFKLLPENLQFFLRQELYGPYVTRVPFLFSISSLSITILSELCKNCVQEKSVLKGEEVFQHSEEAKCVYILVSGNMEYKHSTEKLQALISSGQWVSEPTLWLAWRHRATMVSNTSCEVMALQGSCVRKVISSVVELLQFTKNYAQIFARCVASTEKMELTDVWLDVEQLNHWVCISWESAVLAAEVASNSDNMDAAPHPSLTKVYTG